MPRFYSVEEANQLLPQLVGVLRGLQVKKRQLDAAEKKLTALRQKVRRNGHSLDEQTMDGLQTRAGQLAEEIEAEVSRVHDLGVEVKDLRLGLVDFRSRREGREVRLCWRLGEERVMYWHELDTGYGGRQPL